MDTIIHDFLVVGCVNLFMWPLFSWLMKRVIWKRLDLFDEKRELARVQQAEDERLAREQRDAERTIILAMSRSMLLNNYEKCMAKGFYSVEEREVYSKLYQAYKSDGGNSVIDAIAPRIRALPLESPRDGSDN